MNVAIEALGIDRPGGGRSATLNLFRALFALDQESRYVVFVSKAEQALSGYPNVRQVILGPLPALAARLWAQAVVPLYLKCWPVNLLHHVKNLTVAGAPCPSIVTVYDLTILRHPDLYPAIDLWYWRNIQPRALHAATRVVAISQMTAQDLVQFYDLPTASIDVIYPSCAPGFVSGASDPERVRRRYGIVGNFVLHVGSISRKKNLLTLLRAFQRLRWGGRELKLVLVGRVYQKGQDRSLGQFLASTEFARDVIFTGPVADEDLSGLYRAATVVAFPSLHEGFGIVPVEAMACGAPLVASSGGALGEVVGTGGWLLKDARDDAELAAALERVMADPDLRSDLIKRARHRAADFSPTRTAMDTLNLYRRVSLSAGLAEA